MNNEKASATIQCHFSKSRNTYTPTLMCNYGDLYQLYIGDHNSNPTCQPNFNDSSPGLVEFWLNNSDGSVVPASNITNVDWYVGNVKLNFASDTKKSQGTTFLNVFQRVDPSSTAKPGLKIIKNLVGPLAGLSSVLKAVATVMDANGNPESQSASIPIILSQVTQDSYSISIKAVSGELGITQNGQVLQVTALSYCGVSSLAYGSEWRLIWDLFIDGAWVRRAETSSGVIKIEEKEVQSCLLVRAVLVKTADVSNYANAVIDNPDSANYVRPWAIDTAVIYDTSDPYIINPNPTPEDCTLTDTGSVTQITLAPTMTRRDGTPAPGTVKFDFTALSLSGVKMKESLNVSAGGTFALTVADFNQSADINVNIDGTCTITT